MISLLIQSKIQSPYRYWTALINRSSKLCSSCIPPLSLLLTAPATWPLCSFKAGQASCQVFVLTVKRKRQPREAAGSGKGENTYATYAKCSLTLMCVTLIHIRLTSPKNWNKSCMDIASSEEWGRQEMISTQRGRDLNQLHFVGQSKDSRFARHWFRRGKVFDFCLMSASWFRLLVPLWSSWIQFPTPLLIPASW